MGVHARLVKSKCVHRRAWSTLCNSVTTNQFAALINIAILEILFHLPKINKQRLEKKVITTSKDNFYVMSCNMCDPEEERKSQQVKLDVDASAVLAITGGYFLSLRNKHSCIHDSCKSLVYLESCWRLVQLAPIYTVLCKSLFPQISTK